MQSGGERDSNTRGQDVWFEVGYRRQVKGPGGGWAMLDMMV